MLGQARRRVIKAPALFHDSVAPPRAALGATASRVEMSSPERPVVTRIAPSPTGVMHIGTARTALFNWLYARHFGGEFLLRIEDTDRERSTADAVQAIFDGLSWLGLEPDRAPVLQHERSELHRAAVEALL